MANSAFQGFDRNLNLRENTDDRDVLNNLGGAPIVDDLILFLNNGRNISVLEVSNTEVQDSLIQFDNTQLFVYTDGTEVSVANTVYYVGDSNNVNEFRLYTDRELTNLVSNPPTGTYIRSDSVTLQNISNLVRERDKVVEDILLTQIGVIGDTENQNIYTSIIETYAALTPGFSQTNISGYIDSIETELDFFNLKKSKSILNTGFDTESNISLSGAITITDPLGLNDTLVSANSGPGVFIYDNSTDTATRIFSGNENVWEESGSDLVVNSKEISVGNLVAEEGLRILRKSGAPAIETISSPANSFTHFITVFVNGEEYNLLLA